MEANNSTNLQRRGGAPSSLRRIAGAVELAYAGITDFDCIGERDVDASAAVREARDHTAVAGKPSLDVERNEWWRGGVLYQCYLRVVRRLERRRDRRSAAASSTHLDHLAWLGVDAIWLSPITLSPNADWGYDVADYCAVIRSSARSADLDG